MITKDMLKDVLHYNPNTGVFVWRKNLKPAGCVAVYRKLKYRKIRVCGVLYFAHRLAWLYQTGEWPDDEIDHINHDGIDNRWENIRKCSASENVAHRMPWRIPHGFKGIAKNGNRWVAQISSCSGGSSYIGIFKTKHEAASAYDQAAIEKFGDFAVTNKSLGLLP